MRFTKRQLAAAAKSSVQMIAPSLQPDGDWTPMMLVAHHEEITIVSLGMPDEEEWHFIRDVGIPSVLQQMEGYAALVYTAWQANFAADAPRELLERTGAANHPKRKEVVTILAVDESGREGWTSEIMRRPGLSPDIGSWEPSNYKGGHVLEALLNGLGVQ